MKNVVRCLMIVSLLLALGFFADSALAGGGPENVAVVVNADSWASQAIANEFMRLRHIPPNNVIYLALGDMPDFATVTVDTFRDKVLKPSLSTIKDRGLAGQIDYLVYSTDIPNSVDFTSDTNGRKLPSPFNCMTASATGLTYLYQRVLDKNINYLSLGANHYARHPLQVDAIAIMNSNLLMTVHGMMQSGRYESAEKLLADMLKKRPNNPAILYDHACALARLGKTDDALKELAKAVDHGFIDADNTANDQDFKSLADKDAFKALLVRMKTAASKPAATNPKMDDTINTQPTLAFRGSQMWDARGELDIGVTGDSYLLSTFLAWTSGRGNSVREALDCLRRGAQADGSRPKGTIYYILNTDVRAQARQWGFASAVARLKELGVNAEIFVAKNTNDLPANTTDIAGMMAGSADFSFPSSSKILPGAICEHLTSFGGNLNEDCFQTAMTNWIRAGASGTSGAVTEPYAVQQKFPMPFIQVHYAKGCSLAEAFYQSIAGPYQLLIVGDPLCKPWAKIPKVQLPGVRNGDTLKGTVTMTPSVENQRDAQVDQWELFVDGKRLSTVQADQPLTLDTAQLSDGYHDLRVVAIAAGAIHTQGEIILGVAVDNGGHTAFSKALDGGTVKYGQVARVTAKAPGAKSLVLTHNGRSIGNVESSEGIFQVDSRVLGTGKVTLQAIGLLDTADTAAARVYCPPVELTVEPPAAMPATRFPVNKMVRGGLLLGATPKPMPLTCRIGENWLKKVGAKPKQDLCLTGFVEAATDDMYQFQVYTDGTFELIVDGQKIIQPSGLGKGWRFLPVNLKAGSHNVVVKFTTGPNMVLNIRYGGSGTQTLQEKNFGHLPL